MLCYRDMTFCDAPCAATDCSRKFTDEVLEGAKAWWGKDGAPIALSDFRDECGKYEPEEKDG